MEGLPPFSLFFGIPVKIQGNSRFQLAHFVTLFPNFSFMRFDQHIFLGSINANSKDQE